MRGDLADLPAGWVAAWSDGACAGNPGPMGIGGLVRDREGGLVAMFSEAAGRGTNNEAEYLALDRAIRLAAELGAEGVVVCSDSELVVRQLTGDYRVRNGRLHAYWSRARGAMTAFPGSVRLEWVSRVYNFDADALASRAVGMPQAPLAAEGAIPWVPRPPAETSVELPAVPASVTRLMRRRSPKFRDFLSLRVGGTDTFSRLAPEDLRSVIEARHGAGAWDWLEAALMDATDRYARSACRWAARGLSPDLALKKASVDKEMGRG